MSKEEIFGREKEKGILNAIWNSKEAEFVAIYGRRRVGKTFLIRQYFSFVSYIVTVPLDSGDIIGIVYVWIGNTVHPDDALLAQEIANDMYNVRK